MIISLNKKIIDSYLIPKGPTIPFEEINDEIEISPEIRENYLNIESKFYSLKNHIDKNVENSLKSNEDLRIKNDQEWNDYILKKTEV